MAMVANLFLCRLKNVVNFSKSCLRNIFFQIFKKFSKLFDPLKVIIINYWPQIYDSQTLLSISLCTQLGTYSLHPIGYTFCEPNQVHIHFFEPNQVHELCIKVSALESPIWSRDCVPNWVHYGLHPIGYNKSYTNDILKAGQNFAAWAECSSFFYPRILESSL